MSCGSSRPAKAAIFRNVASSVPPRFGFCGGTGQRVSESCHMSPCFCLGHWLRRSRCTNSLIPQFVADRHEVFIMSPLSFVGVPLLTRFSHTGRHLDLIGRVDHQILLRSRCSKVVTRGQHCVSMRSVRGATRGVSTLQAPWDQAFTIRVKAVALQSTTSMESSWTENA